MHERQRKLLMRDRILESIEHMKEAEKRPPEKFALSVLSEMVRAATNNAITVALQKALESDVEDRFKKR